jgi:hypothetical protein
MIQKNPRTNSTGRSIREAPLHRNHNKTPVRTMATVTLLRKIGKGLDRIISFPSKTVLKMILSMKKV